MMNVIHLDAPLRIKSIGSVIPASQLIKNYALSDFRIESDAGSFSLRLGDFSLGDYGVHPAIFMEVPTGSEEVIVIWSDTEIGKSNRAAGLVYKKDSEGNYVAFPNEELASLSVYWFLVNDIILKKHKNVIKIGKRRHLIQELSPEQSAHHIQKPIRISDGITYTWEYENPRSYNRHCEAWGVRGHYRHYKSGKVVFIQPFNKGAGRLKDSLYEI